MPEQFAKPKRSEPSPDAVERFSRGALSHLDIAVEPPPRPLARPTEPPSSPSSAPTKTPLVRLNVSLTLEVRAALEKLAAAENRSMSQVLLLHGGPAILEAARRLG